MGMTRRPVLLAAVACLAATAVAGAAESPSHVYETRAGYVPLYRIVDDTGAAVRWDARLGRVDLERSGGRISFFVNDDLVVTRSGRVARLGQAFRQERGAILLPLAAMRHLFRELSLPGESWVFRDGVPARPDLVRTNLPAARVTNALQIRPVTGRIGLVVLDAGHGGRDPGAIGHGGLREADIVLDITERVVRRLRGDGLRVELTRKGNETVSLEQRADFANALLARGHRGLFVSIHANASLSSARRGYETYFLSPIASSSEARSTAAIENGSLVGDLPEKGSGPMEKIFSKMLVEEYRRESVQLADAIQAGLGAMIGGASPNREVRKANFYVMRCIFMPSVLVETGFITNPREAGLMRTVAYRERIAEGIARGIRIFIASTGGSR